MRVLGLVLLLAWNTGCADRSRPITPIDADTVVMAFGDSLTSGVGATAEESYPAVLAELLGCTVINSGVSGEITRDGLKRLPHELDKYRPDLVILCHGGNDLLRLEDRERLADNLGRMIALVNECGADVVLVGVPKLGLLLRTADLYGEVARQHQVPFEEDTIAKILSTPSQKYDQVHPNDTGYARLARAVAEVIWKHEDQP